jgi:hypothetical protein
MERGDAEDSGAGTEFLQEMIRGKIRRRPSMGFTKRIFLINVRFV